MQQSHPDSVNNKYQKQKAKAVLAGTCNRCGQPNDTAQLKCEVCQELQKQYRETYKRRKIDREPPKPIPLKFRKLLNLCLECGDKPVPGRKTCRACQEIARIRSLSLRQRRKAAQKCIYCRVPLAAGYTANGCLDCREKRRQKYLLRREEKIAYGKQRLDRCVKEGRCHYCGEKHVNEGSLCLSCAFRRGQCRRARVAKQRAQGKCFGCRCEYLGPYQYCDDCRAKRRASLERSRQKKRG